MSAPTIDPRQLLLPFDLTTPPPACSTCEEAAKLLRTTDPKTVAAHLGFGRVYSLKTHLARHGRTDVTALLSSLPRSCSTCDEAAHLLGSDSFENVAQRLGFSSLGNLRVHLARHGNDALTTRYDVLERSAAR